MKHPTTTMAAGAAPAGGSAGPTRADVQAYWDRAHDAYLAHVGTTFQAGRIAAGTSMRESNVWLARAAGLEPGQRVLDAGCGVCGPAIDIAREVSGLRIVGITVVRRQATAAAGLIAQATLADRVHVVHGDFHAPPFADGAFDAVMFLESIGHAEDLVSLLDNVRRVLKPAGTLYIKDVFRRDPLWSDQERDELAAFDRAYRYRTRPLAEFVEAAALTGFADVTTRDLTGRVSTAHARCAMFDTSGGLTSFGRLHYRRHTCLPVYFAEMKARSPRSPNLEDMTW